MTSLKEIGKRFYNELLHKGEELAVDGKTPLFFGRAGQLIGVIAVADIVQLKCKLVGAVTHVLVNSPDTGYGIFIENMLDTAS